MDEKVLSLDQAKRVAYSLSTLNCAKGFEAGFPGRVGFVVNRSGLGCTVYKIHKDGRTVERYDTIHNFLVAYGVKASSK